MTLRDLDADETGGGALVLGFLLVALLLYRDPLAGLEAATAGPQSTLFFLVLPLAGLAAGAYAYRGGPYNGAGLFVFGTYLGLFGVSLTFGRLAAGVLLDPIILVGVAALALGVVALVASVYELVVGLVPDAPSRSGD